MNLKFRIVSGRKYKRFKGYKYQIRDLINKLGGESEGDEPQILQSSVLDCLDGDERFDVLDIGANSGEWAISFARRFPQSRIHCIEADVRTYGLLKQNLTQHKNITPYNLACSSHNGDITIYSHENTLLTSMLKLPGTSGKTRQVRIKSMTVDNFISEQSISGLALIKIDTEGADLDVIMGSDAVLRSPELAIVILEFGINNEDARHVHLNRFLEVLMRYNFCLASIAGFGVHSNYLYANALFARRLSEGCG